MIEPENLSTAMDFMFEEQKDWVECFKIFKKSDHVSNLESLFVYYLIRKQVDIKDFQLVFKEIVSNSEPWQLKRLYNCFFNTSITLGIGKYLEQDRYNNNFSDAQNMRYIFLTRENKITLEKTSIDYLKVMFTSQPSSLVDSGITPFFYDLTPNLSALKPVFQTLQGSPDGNKVLIPLFHAISTMSYDLPESVSKTSYSVLVESVPNIQKEFEANLVYPCSHPEPGVQLNPSLMNFLNVCQADGLSMINNRYQEEYQKLLQNPVDVSNKPALLHNHYKHEPFVKLALSLSSNIRMGYKADLPLDLGAIDTKESALKNFVYLKALEVKLNNNEPIKASLELCDYVSAINQREKEEVMPSIGAFLDLEMLDKTLIHSRLDYSLGAKSATTKKPKI